MIQIPKIDIHPYWELVKRRKWWLIIPFLLVTVSGAGYIATAPKEYRASTLILVEAQRVPSRYVKSTISQDLRSRLHTITQQIKSRSYLKKVITRNDLTKRESSWEDHPLIEGFFQLIRKVPFVSEAMGSQSEKEEKSMYAMIKMLRNKIDVSLHGRRNSAFEVSFEWRDPGLAADVANALASQFIEQNLNLRAEMAMGTTDFLDLQVQQLRNKLQKKEQQLEEFRNENMGKLPGQLDSNLSILTQLKEEKNNLQERIDQEMQQVTFLQEKIDSDSRNDQLTQDSGESSPDQELAQLKQEIDRLKSKYTENHPDVVALRKRIQAVEESLRQGNATQNTETNASSSTYAEKNSATTAAEEKLKKAETRIRRYRQQVAELNKEIAKYQKRVEQTPQVKMKLRDLQRNYETVKDRYEDLLAKKLDASMAEELEKRQKGEQFKVIDSAIPPKSPFKPDVGKLGLMTLVLGLGMGGGLAYLRETLDPAFYTADDAEKQLGRKIIVSLPWEEANKSSS